MGRFFMRKNFHIDWKQREATCVWTGHYELRQLTEQRLQCVVDELIVVLEGESVEVEAMYEQQLIVSVEALSRIQIEAHDE